MALIEACEKKSLPIYKTYGMTETFSQSVTFSVLEYPHKRESVGKPLPGMQVRIDNSDTDGGRRNSFDGTYGYDWLH